ncbi:ABC transporter ATP-binding protein [Pseudooceanicola sp. CBS1P-1]|uniref:ATP-binding cassette domain-containing protein n=1 Tax=Pseudooceanicola albus TaxID=2692189 RepID=A0A6L7G544_9RHOB|nr:MULTISPECIES: ABC transporter ATP-binding protein [Pseudooceanicola]MBT9385218.1 ABC transporter ATP-binding protein [Pseudooceanicola endophyticus]MXN18490.1 ATP-binding cassette domain-containing protein [Pseudooceanicola albus]
MSAPAPSLEAVGMTMRFGDFTALDNVSLSVPPGSFHALLGENGAGKSTLVKCIMGFYHATSGALLVDYREARIQDPRDAQALGLGMVYQHFTLVPSLSAAENLVISRGDTPALINWAAERARLEAFLAGMPFRVPLDRPVSSLAAGEKQKLEILKQLYLGSRFLILDEPTSVLTPDEADEVLGHVKALTVSGALSVLMISHKFREVRAFADDVTVLRRGALAGRGRVAELTNEDMAAMMMGKAQIGSAPPRTGTPGDAVLELRGARARDRSGFKEIGIEDLKVRAGEIVGVAGISGNGQVELMEVLTGQRRLLSGAMTVQGAPYAATRAQARRHRVRYLPEEPLHNACAPHMSVAENLALRDFDSGRNGTGGRIFLGRARMARRAEELIRSFDIRTRGPQAQIRDLSGGNVQRAALARELSGDVALLVVANPCFGLDFSAARAIRDRLMQARNDGVAVLLISEDLDEILELADRVLVMSDGHITHEARADQAKPAELGRYMAGHAA